MFVTLVVGVPRLMGWGRAHRQSLPAAPVPLESPQPSAPRPCRSSLQNVSQTWDVHPPGQADEAVLTAERVHPSYQTG